MARLGEFCSGAALGLGCGCAGLVLGLMFLIGLASPDTNSKDDIQTSTKKSVSRNDFGDRWPFTVDSGELLCVPPGAAVFRARGTDYQINGLAKSAGYAPIDPIWRNDPQNPKVKVSIGEMIDLALGLCR